MSKEKAGGYVQIPQMVPNSWLNGEIVDSLKERGICDLNKFTPEVMGEDFVSSHTLIVGTTDDFRVFFETKRRVLERLNDPRDNLNLPTSHRSMRRVKHAIIHAGHSIKFGSWTE